MIIIWSLHKLFVWLQSVSCLGHVGLKGIFFLKKNLDSSYIWASNINKCTSAKFVQFMDMGQNVAQSRGHLLYIGLCRENINTYFI